MAVTAMRRPRLRLAEITQVRLRLGMVQSFADWQQEFARASVVAVPTVCNGCQNRCGVVAHVKAGRLWHLTGNPNHAENLGAICDYASDYAAGLYHPGRLTQPLRRSEAGTFVPTAWPQAMSEIASRLKTIVATHGPEAVAFVARPNPTVEYYGRRLMAVLGSPNFIVAASHTAARDAAYHTTLGFVPRADLSRTRFAVFMGRSGLDSRGPHFVHGLAAARAAGARVVVVDPVGDPALSAAGEWVPIRPGTDLALLLAWAHLLIREGLCDQEFVDRHVDGFAELRAAVAHCTPDWAEPITTVPAQTIADLARAMAAHRPAAVIMPGNGGDGEAYANALAALRAQAAVNVLLGNIGQPGGLCRPGDPQLGDLPVGRFPPPPRPAGVRANGAGENGGVPVAPAATGVPSRVLEMAAAGRVKGLILHRVNPAQIPGQWDLAALRASSDLVVVIDLQTPLWAEGLAHFLLPECHYLERDEIVEPVAAHPAQIALGQRAIHPLSPETRSLDEIITWLVRPTAWGRYFSFTLPDVNWARLSPYLVSCAQLHEAGAITLDDSNWPDPEFRTAAGRIPLAGAAWTALGVASAPGPGEFRPLRGRVTVVPGAGPVRDRSTSENPRIDAVWIHPGRAAQLHLTAGDHALVRAPRRELVARVQVTDRIHPEALLLPPPAAAPAGGRVPKVIGLCGGPLTNEVTVTVEKQR